MFSLGVVKEAMLEGSAELAYLGEYLRMLLFHCGECVSDELGYGVLEECVAGLLQGWAWAFTDPV